MKVAIVHYWLVSARGGEKVVEALCEMFPDADVFCHVYDPSAVPVAISNHRIQTTFINRLPGARKHYKRYLPLMPLALESLDFRRYDLIISSESGPAKGIVVPPGTLHICYCHTPMRYVWDLYHEYRTTAGRLTRLMMPYVMHYLRMWDFASAARVDYFIANSTHVAERIRKVYRRDSFVIHPPVNTDDFQGPAEAVADFYLMVGELVPYKRADLAIRAFNRMGRKLVVIGGGEQLASLRKLAKENVELLGWQPWEVIREHYRACRALVFPGEEDFGIVPVEAMAAGRPVIAFNRGGARDTVIDGVTGVFFDEQTEEGIIEAVERFERCETTFSPDIIQAHARTFHRDVFKRKMWEVISGLLTKHSYDVDRHDWRQDTAATKC